jgi:simple sugar transport system permease protein
MLLLIQYTLIFSSVLILVALGGCISEHSGVINLGLEGIMVIGALGGALVMRYCNTSSAFVMVMLSILAAMLFQKVLGLLPQGVALAAQFHDLAHSKIPPN